MNRSLRAAAGILLATCAGCSFAQGLSFDDAITLASHESPALVVSAEELEAARQAAVSAGALPDSRLILGLDNFPVDGPDQYSFSRDFMTMQRIGVMQEFPNRAKREARTTGAKGRIAVAEARTRLALLEVTRQAASAWIERSTVERQLAQIESLDTENRLFDALVHARLAGGQGIATEAVAARQEAAAIEDRRDELRARREKAIAALRQWIGTSAELPLAGEVPDWNIDRELLLHGLQHHPEFALLDAQARTIDAEVAEARAAKRSDWSMEIAYQRRGPQFGNMVSLELTVDLPVFAASRQDPQIAARQAARRALEADREVELREHVQMLESELADYHRLGRAVIRQRDVLVPLAEDKVLLATADWRGGKVSVMEVISARRERIEAALKQIDLEGERLQVAASLHLIYEQISGELP